MAAGEGGGPRLQGEEKFVYLKYWKPRGVTCTTDRSVPGNIVGRVNHPTARVFMVGRLDKDSSGLMLLTSGACAPPFYKVGREERDEKPLRDRRRGDADEHTARGQLQAS